MSSAKQIKEKARLAKLKRKQKQEAKDREVIEKFKLEEGESFFTAKKWTAVATWRYDVEKGGHSCLICKEDLQAPTPEDAAYGRRSGVSFGKCKHVFHCQCINRWLTVHKQKLCPICSAPWEEIKKDE